MPSISAPVSGPSSGQPGPRPAWWLAVIVIALFFCWGFCTVLVDALIPKLKGLFALTQAQAMLVTSAFFFAYFVFSLPAGWLITRIGYFKGIVAGLLVMALGCLLFSPAASMGSYVGFLLALFILAGGITILQVAANPLMANLGDPSKSHARLTLAQAFNSLGTVIGPWFGALFILRGEYKLPDPATMAPAALDALRKHEAQVVQVPYFGIAVALSVLALVFWLLRNARSTPHPESGMAGSYVRALRQPRVSLGVLSIFLYVGAEVAIGGAMVNYLMQGHVLGPRLPGLGQTLGHLFGGKPLNPAQAAGFMVSLYWGCAMIGRFAGSWVLGRVRAGTTLLICALIAAALAVTSGLSVGVLAGATVIVIGLFNSIMFPTIFTLAIEGLGEDTPEASGLLCMAIVGGAVVPYLLGKLADNIGLSLALFLPAACYIWIAVYGLLTRIGKVDRRAADEVLAEVLG